MQPFYHAKPCYKLTAKVPPLTTNFSVTWTSITFLFVCISILRFLICFFSCVSVCLVVCLLVLSCCLSLCLFYLLSDNIVNQSALAYFLVFCLVSLCLSIVLRSLNIFKTLIKTWSGSQCNGNKCRWEIYNGFTNHFFYI